MTRAFPRTALAALFAVGTSAAASGEDFDVSAIEIRDFIGAVEIVTTDRQNVSVTVFAGEGLMDPPELFVDEDDEALEVRGPRGYRDTDCQIDDQGGVEVRLPGQDWSPLAALPRVVIEAPRAVSLYAEGGAVFGTVGDVAAAEVRVDGCGVFEIGDVAGGADLAINGSGEVILGDAGEAELTINGSGTLTAGQVAGQLSIEINGSGDVVVASVDGPTDVSLRGSGDARIQGGRATGLTASIFGSGDVRFDGVAVGARVTIFGSGDVRIADLSGDLRTTGFGSGDVRVGD